MRRDHERHHMELHRPHTKQRLHHDQQQSGETQPDGATTLFPYAE